MPLPSIEFEMYHHQIRHCIEKFNNTSSVGERTQSADQLLNKWVNVINCSKQYKTVYEHTNTEHWNTFINGAKFLQNCYTSLSPEKRTEAANIIEEISRLAANHLKMT